MLKNIRIFVEGDDKLFIEQYILWISERFQEKIALKTISTGGWTNLHKHKNEFKENADMNGINLVIFDADDNFRKRETEILQRKKELGIDFKLFLFPDNNAPGDFETLLEKIAIEKHQQLFDCFEKYQECLTNKNGNYKVPNRKAKIFAYLESLNEETNFKKRVLLGISWITIMFENNMQIFINKLLIPNRFLPSQSLNHFVWLCSGRNDAVY